MMVTHFNIKLSSPSLKSQSPKVKTKRTWADTIITSPVYQSSLTFRRIVAKYQE